MKRIKGNKIGQLLIAILSTMACVGLFGCSTAPTPKETFKSEENIPPQKALVYIYRPGARGGTAEWTLRVNGQPITVMRNEGYFPYFAQPGTNRFSIGPVHNTFGYIGQGLLSPHDHHLLDLNITAGLTYYLYFKFPPNFFGGYPLLIDVGQEKGGEAIKKTKRLADYTPEQK